MSMADDGATASLPCHHLKAKTLPPALPPSLVTCAGSTDWTVPCDTRMAARHQAHPDGDSNETSCIKMRKTRNSVPTWMKWVEYGASSCSNRGATSSVAATPLMSS